LAIAGLLVSAVVAANVLVALKGGDATDSVADAPHAQAAIVPGALVKPDGEMSSMLADRVRRAAELWEAGGSTASSSPAITAGGPTTSPGR
jgi:SanA protein